MWLLLQLADSAFPAGGFAHSAGLEAAYQAGEIGGRGELRRFVEDALWQAGHSGLPLLRGPLSGSDARAEAFLVNHVANRASRQQGRAFLDTCARAFPTQIGPLREEARAAKLHLHHAPIFGAAVQLLGVSLEDAQRLYLFIALRGFLGAAVRLGAIGTLESQALQAELTPLLDRVLDRCRTLDAPAQTSPLADLLSATHDRLYSRLFVS